MHTFLALLPINDLACTTWERSVLLVVACYWWPRAQVALIAASLLQQFSFSPPEAHGSASTKPGPIDAGVASQSGIDLEPVYGQTMHPTAYALRVNARASSSTGDSEPAAAVAVAR